MDFQHVVLIKFPRALTDAERTWMDDLIGHWPETIGGITSLRWGWDVSGRARGYAFGIVITFVSAAAAAAYQPHPRHQEFARWVAQEGGEVLAWDVPGDPARVRP
jgi:hypothetical protein